MATRNLNLVASFSSSNILSEDEEEVKDIAEINEQQNSWPKKDEVFA